jgi:hypothetical protein
LLKNEFPINTLSEYFIKQIGKMIVLELVDDYPMHFKLIKVNHDYIEGYNDTGDYQRIEMKNIAYFA